MTRFKKISMVVLLLLGTIGAASIAYQVGYRAGLRARDNTKVAIAIKRTTGPGQFSTSCLWFNLEQPGEASKFRDTLRSLREQGADFYVTEPKIEVSLSPMPDPRHVNAIFSGSGEEPSPANEPSS